RLRRGCLARLVGEVGERGAGEGDEVLHQLVEEPPLLDGVGNLHAGERRAIYSLCWHCQPPLSAPVPTSEGIGDRGSHALKFPLGFFGGRQNHTRDVRNVLSGGGGVFGLFGSYSAIRA